MGSWGIIVKLCLNNSKPIWLISISSIYILPSDASNIRKIHSNKVDFPLPVCPTTPIFSPGFISKLIFFKIKGVSGLYLTL
jgi:hypothetical protein